MEPKIHGSGLKSGRDPLRFGKSETWKIGNLEKSEIWLEKSETWPWPWPLALARPNFPFGSHSKNCMHYLCLSLSLLCVFLSLLCLSLYLLSGPGFPKMFSKTHFSKARVCIFSGTIFRRCFQKRILRTPWALRPMGPSAHGVMGPWAHDPWDVGP